MHPAYVQPLNCLTSLIGLVFVCFGSVQEQGEQAYVLKKVVWVYRPLWLRLLVHYLSVEHFPVCMHLCHHIFPGLPEVQLLNVRIYSNWDSDEDFLKLCLKMLLLPLLQPPLNQKHHLVKVNSVGHLVAETRISLEQ